ncbi:MAG: YfhO family protein [Elusimicrobia bacterium]|nr:YfhO family protein [Elusimicrobiota bacterium]
MIRPRDLAPLLLLLATSCALLSPVLFTPRAYFFQDVTHINFAWRTLTAEQLQRGLAPLWNPYSNFGAPLLGNFQTGVLFPPSVIFDLFPFPHALGWYLLFAYALGGGGAYLWLRALGLSRASCLGGAAAFSFSGYFVSHTQFPNLIGTLAWFPWLFLLSGTPALLALAVALCFLSGYPPIWAGLMGALFGLRWIWPTPRDAGVLRHYGGMLAGALAGTMLCAAALLPGLELARRSGRGAVLPLKERTVLSYEPFELASLVHPELARALARRLQEPHPGLQQVVWEHDGTVTRFSFPTGHIDPLEDPAGAKITSWKSGYVGFGAAAAALVGAAAFALAAPAEAAALAAFVATACVVMLGNTTALSSWAWLRLPGLSFLRGPGRLSYLVLCAAIPLAAMGLERIRRLAGARGRVAAWAAAVGAIGILAELVCLGWGFYPTISKSDYAVPGPLVEFLRRELNGDRFFSLIGTEVSSLNKEDPSPEYRAYRESVFKAYRQKLFGISNASFHLAAGSGEFEPLVFSGTERVQDAMKNAPEPKRPGLMRWTDTRFLFDFKPPRAPGLLQRGRAFWHLVETKRPVGRAYWFPESWRERLAGGIQEMPEDAPGERWTMERLREDRSRIVGAAKEPGILYLAEPRYPGWSAYVNGRPAAIENALTAFSRISLPEGTVRVDLLYRPASWRFGALLTILTLALFAAFGGRRLMSFQQRPGAAA